VDTQSSHFVQMPALFTAAIPFFGLTFKKTRKNSGFLSYRGPASQNRGLSML
jgi:hypothetical protein